MIGSKMADEQFSDFHRNRVPLTWQAELKWSNRSAKQGVRP